MTARPPRARRAHKVWLIITRTSRKERRRAGLCLSSLSFWYQLLWHGSPFGLLIMRMRWIVRVLSMCCMESLCSISLTLLWRVWLFATLKLKFAMVMPVASLPSGLLLLSQLFKLLTSKLKGNVASPMAPEFTRPLSSRSSYSIYWSLSSSATCSEETARKMTTRKRSRPWTSFEQA